MNEQKGLMVLFVLLSLTGIVLLGTAVFYHALCAYNSAQKCAQAYQHEYVLDGLVNHAINQCRVAEHAHTPITRELSQAFNPWIILGTRSFSGTIVITPTKSNYTITASAIYGLVVKKRQVLLSHNS